jgi:Tfp pilus assembly protein PilO
MQLSTLKPNERRLLVIVAAILGTWAILSWVIQPLWSRAADLRLEAESQTERLSVMSRLAQESPRIQRIYEALAPYLADSDPKQAHQAFLAELETLSRDAGLTLNLKPKEANPQAQQAHFMVELEVQGSQAQLLGFLDSLLSAPRLVTLERMRIASIPSTEDKVRANLVLYGIVPSASAQNGRR